MALKTYKPITPSLRQLVIVDRTGLWKGKPVKALTRGKKKTGGRNNHGRITSNHMGGGHKQRLRLVDFKRRKFDVAATVERLEYDPNRSAFIALIKYADGELAYFTTWCPAGTPIETLVAVEGRRWAIEDAFETAKNELGLDHNETRSWHGWHRHVSLVMLAFAMLAAIRHHANAPTPPKTPIRLARTRQASSAGRSRNSAASPCGLPSNASSPPTSSPGRRGDGPTKLLRSAHI